jgi:23S rRNA pseudouridine1911/1915/1917 synthase
MNPTVIFEDNHLLAINKPFCMPSQGDETGDLNVFDWAKGYLKEKYAKPGNIYVGLLHRLDRPTGGILLLAKTSKAAGRLSQDFQENKVQKTYWAITEKIPDVAEGTLSHFLAKLPDKNIVKAYNKQVYGAKPALLTYKTLQIVGTQALIEVNPKTGRQHQIRVQLASMGCTICGDAKYGKSNFLPDKSIALLAQKVIFKHPTKDEEVTLSLSLPESAIWQKFQTT